MSIFDDYYNNMELVEVCYRLPGDLAVSALIRRIDNLPTLLDFVKTIGSQPQFVPELKTHINKIIAKESVADVMSTFEQKLHRSLFDWLDDENKKRIKGEGRSQLDYKFLFNVSSDKDLEDLQAVLGQILQAPDLKHSAVLAVLDRADKTIFPDLMNIVLQDPRPEAKQLILAVNSQSNNQLISDYQRTIALKAFVKTGSSLKYINRQNFKSFTALKPKERLDALKKYLGHFPLYRKVDVFDPMPSQEEFDMILFSGCIEHNDLVVELSKRYKEITQEDPPAEECDDDEV